MSWELPNTLIHWLAAGACAAVVAFFGAGLTMYFERAPRPAWVLLVHYTSLVLALAQIPAVLFLDTRSDGWVALAIAMYTGAIAVFLSAIESAKRTRLQRSFIDLPLPDRLITDGPFAWVRHPFCSGYLLGALAGPVAIDHPAIYLITLPLIVISVSAAVREERVWLSSSRAEDYRDYRRRTGMFVPFVGRG